MVDPLITPSVIAAIATAAGPLLGKVLDLFGGKRDKVQDTAAQETALKAYDTLKNNVSGGCARILRLMEYGSMYYPSTIREKLYPDLALPSAATTPFDNELRYRLEYMRLNGLVVQITGGEYGITRLGLAFLEEARQRRDFYDELAPR